MATYQYECKDCSLGWEIQRPIHDEERIPTCPGCDQKMKKVFSSPSVNLVGRGFYRNGG